MEQIYKFKTKENLKILFIDRPKNPKMINFYLNVGIGSDMEKNENLEIGHFLEHLFVSMTSNKYPSSIINRNYFMLNSINYNASIGNKNTMYEYSFKREKMDKFIEFFFNGLLDFKVDENIFESEKNSIIQELNEIIDDTNFKLDTLLDSNLYENHNRSISQVKRKQNSLKMTSKRVEEYYNKYYNLNLCVLTIYGNVNKKQIIKKINLLEKQVLKSRYQIKQKAKESLHYLKLYKPNLKLSPLNNLSNNVRVYHCRKDDSISTLKISFKLNFDIFDDKYYSLFAIDYIIIHDLGSLLLKHLRTNKQLIYDISSNISVDELFDNMGYYIFTTTIDSSKILEVIKGFFEVINFVLQGKFKIPYMKKYYDYIQQKILVKLDY